MDNDWNDRRYRQIGAVTALALVLGLGVWGTQVQLSGAIVAGGHIEAGQHVEDIQHPDGGVVAMLLVAEGDRVVRGQPLLRLDDTMLAREAALLSSRIELAEHRLLRLWAERDRKPFIAPPGAEDQQRLFDVRLEGDAANLATRDEEIRRIQEEILGLETQRSALAEQLRIAAAMLATSRSLVTRGLAAEPRAQQHEAQVAALGGSLGEVGSAIAAARTDIARVRVEVARQRAVRDERILAELDEVNAQVIELAAQRDVVTDRLSRLEMRAPFAGRVHDLRLHAEGAVLRPAEPALSIVPDSEDMLVRARVAAQDITSVRAGQPVQVRLTALDARLTPAISARVARVSATRLDDERTGADFYSVDIRPEPGALDDTAFAEVVQGMTAESFIETGSRSPLAYLTRPLAVYFRRAFREN